MPNLLTRILLFLSSYAPLLVILAVRNSFANRWACVGLAAIALISVVGLWIYLRLAQSLSSHALVVSSASSRDGDAMSYIVAYLIPFLDINFNDPLNATSLAIVFVVLGVLYVNSNMIYTNPILNLGGYHIFEIHSDDGKVSALICKRSYIRRDSEMSVVPLGDYVLMEKRA